MAEIAKLAGISPGAIYRYFDSKEALARDCVGENSYTVQSQWKQPASAGADALADFKELSRATFEFLNQPEERADTILFLEGLLSAARDDNRTLLGLLSDGNRETLGGIERRIEAVKQQHGFPPEFDSHRLAEALLSFYWGARISRLLDAEANTDGQLEEMIRLLESAAEAQAASRS